MNSIQLPEKLKPLFEPKRYKVLYGGRGGGKSMGVARALLRMGMAKPLRILCAREFQNSIKDSVLKLLEDQIAYFELGGFYEVQKTTILGKNGTEFNFEGLKMNTDKIKSYEGIDICWNEEGQKISKSSWDLLIPTIRKEGSEIWMTFNPELETDETYQRFVLHPPKDSVVINMNYTDNPWFPKVLEAERLECKERDPDGYLNIWEGKCKQALEGAVYANEIRELTQKNQITKVAYDPRSIVNTYWDLGYADTTAIWFIQKVGLEYHVIDYYENNFQSIQHYAFELSKRQYVYGDDWLPHDGNAKSLGTGMTIKEQLEKLGRHVRITPNIRIVDGIAAVRSVLPLCWFDEERCTDGLNALRHYRYNVNASTEELSREPLHDWASHAVDSLRMFAVSIKKMKEKERVFKKKPPIKTGFGRV